MPASIIKLLTFCLTLLIAETAFGQTSKKKITTIPDINLFDLAGKQTTLKTLSNGKVTFIDNWFIPCPPCSREMPLLHELYTEYKSNPQVNFMTICATDPGIVKKFLSNDPSVKQFTHMYHEFSGLTDFKLPIFFIPGCNMRIGSDADLKGTAPDDKTKCPDAQFGFKGYPTVYIFDKHGKLIYSKTGYDISWYKTEKAELQKIIKAALSAN